MLQQLVVMMGILRTSVVVVYFMVTQPGGHHLPSSGGFPLLVMDSGMQFLMLAPKMLLAMLMVIAIQIGQLEELLPGRIIQKVMCMKYRFGREHMLMNVAILYMQQSISHGL